MKNRGFAPVFIAGIITLLVVGSAAGYVIIKKLKPPFALPFPKEPSGAQRIDEILPSVTPIGTEVIIKESGTLPIHTPSILPSPRVLEVVEGQHIVLDLSSEEFSILRDPEAWVKKLDEAYEAMFDLVGFAPYGGGKITIQSVDDFPGGEMTGGNPIRWFRQYVPDKLRSINEYNDLGFGPIHELGHVFDAFDFAVHYIGISEFVNQEQWANFKVLYVADRLSAKYPHAAFYQPQIGYVLLGQFPKRYFVEQFTLPRIKTGRTDWQTIKADEMTGLLYLLKEEIGWEPFRKAFREIARMEPPSPWLPSGVDITEVDLEKVARFADILGKHAGKDIRSRFREWGFAI